jgi:integrase/recombinase XerD
VRVCSPGVRSIGPDPAVYARLPTVHRDESRSQGLDRLELVRLLQVAQTLSVHHGALAYLLGINAVVSPKPRRPGSRTPPTPWRGHRVLHLVGKGNEPAPGAERVPGRGLKPAVQ